MFRLNFPFVFAGANNQATEQNYLQMSEREANYIFAERRGNKSRLSPPRI